MTMEDITLPHIVNMVNEVLKSHIGYLSKTEQRQKLEKVIEKVAEFPRRSYSKVAKKRRHSESEDFPEGSR